MVDLDDPVVDGSSYVNVLSIEGSGPSSYHFQIVEGNIPPESNANRSGSTNKCFRWFFQPFKSKFSLTLFESKNALEKEYRCFNEQRTWIIHPCSRFRLCWAVLILTLLIVNLTVLPVFISFFNDDLNIKMIVFNCVCDVAFVLDIIVNFRTGIIARDSRSVFILMPRRIAEQYFKTWFAVDLVSSIPFDYVYLMTGNVDSGSGFVKAGTALRILRMTKMLSLSRLLRVCRLIRYLLMCEQSFCLSTRVKPLLNLVLLILLSAHWLTCSQFFVPMIADFPGSCWVIRSNIRDTSFTNQYILSFFKATSHMLSLGYGQYPPATLSDAWITTVTMLIGAIFGALLVATLTSVVLYSNIYEEIHNEKVKLVGYKSTTNGHDCSVTETHFLGNFSSKIGTHDSEMVLKPHISEERNTIRNKRQDI